jgi:hypothetical protein
MITAFIDFILSARVFMFVAVASEHGCLAVHGVASTVTGPGRVSNSGYAWRPTDTTRPLSKGFSAALSYGLKG